MTRAISILLVVGVLAAQTDPAAEGLSRFNAGDYRGAAESFRVALKTADQPLARIYLALSRAATGECVGVADQLFSEFNSNQGDLRRAAGLGFVQCAQAKDNSVAAYPVLEQLRAEFPGQADVLYLAARFHMRAWNDVLYDLYQKAPASYRVNQISGEVFEMQG